MLSSYISISISKCLSISTEADFGRGPGGGSYITFYFSLGLDSTGKVHIIFNQPVKLNNFSMPAL